MAGEDFKTVILLGSLTALLILIGGVIGSLFRLTSLGLIVGFLIAMLTNFISYYYSDKITLRAYNAKIITREEEPRLYETVAQLANNAGLKMPKVAIVQSNDPNAFATGRNQDHAVVAATTALLQMLDDNELRGVLGHELGHIKNHDILISSVAASIAGIISLFANLGSYAIFFAGDDDTAGVLVSVLIAIFGPIAASVIQFSISRSREFKADAAGAKFSGDPLALASALRKIEYGVYQNPMENAKPTDAHMFIINPFGNTASKIQELFSTHPKTEERIRRLEQIDIQNKELLEEY